MRPFSTGPSEHRNQGPELLELPVAPVLPEPEPPAPDVPVPTWQAGVVTQSGHAQPSSRMSQTPSPTQPVGSLHTGVASQPAHEQGSPGLQTPGLWQGTHCARPKQSGQVQGSPAAQAPSRCPALHVASSSWQCAFAPQSAQPQPS